MRGGIDEAHTETEMKNCGSISQCGEAQYCKVYDTTSQLWNLWYNCQLFLIPMQGIFFQLPQAPEIGLGLSTKELGRSPLCSCATCYGCFPHCFCWPHTDHILTTNQPHTDHIPTTYLQHTDHIPTTYSTNHIPNQTLGQGKLLPPTSYALLLHY